MPAPLEITPAEYRARLHPHWTGGPLCRSCDDRDESGRRYVEPDAVYRHCSDCPTCAHCHEPIAKRAAFLWVLYLPEIVDTYPPGWCSPECLRLYCAAQSDPTGAAWTLWETWKSVHFAGLEIEREAWHGIRTHRERATATAIFDEWYRLHTDNGQCRRMEREIRARGEQDRRVRALARSHAALIEASTALLSAVYLAQEGDCPEIIQERAADVGIALDYAGSVTS